MLSDNKEGIQDFNLLVLISEEKKNMTKNSQVFQTGKTHTSLYLMSNMLN